jgi:hypothetical protein
MQAKRKGTGQQSNVIALRRRQLPKPELSRKVQLLGQFGIQKPLEIDDTNSVLTIDPGVGATQVDTYAKVPKGGAKDGLFVKLTQTDWATARVEGPGVESQMTVPPRTMAGAFGYWAAQNGSMTLAGKEYKHSELDRDTGEVVLSDSSVDEKGRTVLEQRRLRPSAGTALSGDMLTAMPPKVGLVDFPPGYEPEPAILVAQTTAAELKAGATLHITGKSIEDLKAEVTSIVRPEAGGWADPKGANILMDTWLRVMNTDRAPIRHDAVVLRSGESKGRGYYDEDGSAPSTIHTTELPKAKLKVGPGESQEIRVEKQKGHAHVEYRLNDEIATRPAGEGDMYGESAALRYMVLDTTTGKRHAGALKFYDGINELGSATMKAATPGTAATTSNPKSSGVISSISTKWSDVTPAGDEARAQTVTKDYEFENISSVAGQMKLAIEVDGFSQIDKITINGQELKKSLNTAEFSAKRTSERYGGSKIHVTLDMKPGTEQAPHVAKLKVQIEGKFAVEE